MTERDWFHSGSLFRRRGGRSTSVWILAALVAATLDAQPSPLFSQAFVVEHHVVQRDGDGSIFYGESVTDYYGGSWIVSLRPDERRLIIDLGRRELSEIHPQQGTYWRVSFDRFAELRERYLASELGKDERRRVSETGLTAVAAGSRSEPKLPEPELLVAEVTAPARSESLRSLPAAASTLLKAPAVRHLRVSVLGDPRAARRAMEVWVDPRVQLGRTAQQALAQFENRVLGSVSETTMGDVSPGRLVAAARAHADGAFPVRTVRPLVGPAGEVPGGTIEDLATRLEPLVTFPQELVEVPDGMRRVSHPLEVVLALGDDELGREALVGNPIKPERR